MQSFPFYSSPDNNDHWGIRVGSTSVHEQEENESEHRKQRKKNEYEGVRTKRKGKRKGKGKRSHHDHHHHGHQQENESEKQEHSTRKRVYCHSESSTDQRENSTNQQQQPHSSQHEQQQLQQIDKRNMSSCESAKGVLFTSPSSTMDDKVLCKEFEHQITGERMVVVPTESVTLVTTGGQKPRGKNVLRGGKAGTGRKLLTRAFGSHSPLSSSCSRIKSATTNKMRMSTGITSSSSISPSSSEKGGRMPKDELKLQLQEDILEMKSMTEVGKEKRSMTGRLKVRMMSFMGGRSKEEEENESDVRMENKTMTRGKEEESHKTSRLPSLSNHSSSIHSQGSKSSSGRNNKSDPHLSSHKKKILLPFNYSFSGSSSQPTKRKKKNEGKGTELDSMCDPIRSIHWSSVDLTKVYRVKQVTRSCLNDVVLAAISGN